MTRLLLPVKIIAVVSIFLLGIPVFAADSLEEGFELVDQAFNEKSPDKLSIVLEKFNKNSEYGRLEEFALKKIRQLIIDDDLDLALKASMAVINNNLQNFEAVDLYSSIDNAIQSEQVSRNRRRFATAWTQ